ncbi:MAG: thioredoxin [Bacteroidetes bacterium]|jgi:thiol-disulfide isomerase/thioredoxin|nr:thioredoxin [Bacteroidota bacterium]
MKRIDTTKTPLVVNFWATWCKPCIQELPAFDSLTDLKQNVKVLLVSLDFKEDIKTKVDPFLKKHRIVSECVLLDEVNGNDYINKISTNWSGAIPGTLFKNKETRFFIEKKLHLESLKAHLREAEPK